MSIIALGPQRRPITQHSPLPPPQSTDALGIRGFPCYFVPHAFPCPTTLDSQSHATQGTTRLFLHRPMVLSSSHTHNPSFPSPSWASLQSKPCTAPQPAELQLQDRLSTRLRRKWGKTRGREQGPRNFSYAIKSCRELGVTLTAMLCSEAGDERVSERGRAVRARARRLPARPPARRRRARPYANEQGTRRPRESAGHRGHTGGWSRARLPAGWTKGTASHERRRECEPWDSDTPRGCYSRIAARKAQGFSRAS